MDRYQIKRDTESGIVNDPNEYSDDPKYIVNLIKRVVTVSVETMRIVNSLPDMDWSETTV
jgi:predicted helicase